MDIFGMIRKAVGEKATDLQLVVDSPPLVRVYGTLKPLNDYPILTAEEVAAAFDQLADNEEKKTFMRAEIVRILKPAHSRVSPVCPHFEHCGGCHWQHLEYPSQVEAKRQMLEEAFRHRFPQTRNIPITMHACTKPYAYRSRARMQLRGAGAGASVGFFRCGSHAVVDIERCPLFRESLNEALASLRQFKLKVGTESGPQEMDMACSEEEDAWATARPGPIANEGIIPLIGSSRNEDVLLTRTVGGFAYAVTASVFFQANDFMVPELVALVQECATGNGVGRALDLYAGVGLFSLPLAGRFAEVVAVESSAASVRLCARNAKNAGMGNVRAVCADVSGWMRSGAATAGPPFDLIMLDPPRTGAGADVMDQIRKWAPPAVIYVSCDPQTLVRDLARLAPSGYGITRVAGLDMFPQTFHFESVVRLERN